MVFALVSAGFVSDRYGVRGVGKRGWVGSGLRLNLGYFFSFTLK